MISEKLQDKIKKALSKLDIKTTFLDSGMEIQKYNSYGEDFNEYYSFNDMNELLEEVRKHADYYDIGEYFKMWYGANKGEPTDPEQLLNAGKENQKILEKIADKVEKIIYKEMEAK